MFNSTSAMNLINCLASAAFVGLGAFTLGLLLDQGITASFLLMVSSFLLVAVIRDYSPRRAGWEPRRTTPRARFTGRARVVRRRLSALTAAA
jgi:hypothetical protein